MKTYAYIEPRDPEHGDYSPVEVVYTELEIIQIYFLWWAHRMFKHQQKDLTFEITPENCIDDWVIINWAYEV